MGTGRVVAMNLFGVAGLTLLSMFGCSVAKDQSTGVRVDTQAAKVQSPSLPGAGRPVPALREVAWSFRTIPVDSSVVDPTAFCAAAPTGFTVAQKAGLSLYTYASDRESGQVTEFITHQHVGSVMGCFSAVVNADGVYYEQFYGRISMNSGEQFEGLGRCVIVYGSSPEAGTSQLVCSLKLTVVPAGYSSGILVANTLSRASYARGYNASSLATLRAFRQWPAR